jgi:hypothetical protein
MAESKRTTPFVPPFLEKLGVAPGEWMYTSKASLRALMRPYWPLKVRVWACIMLQSFGYEADLAVAMSRGDFEGAKPKIHPLTPAIILMTLKREAMKAFKAAGINVTDEQAKEMRVSRQNLRRCLAEMEDEDGLIVRAVTAAGAGVLRGLSLKQALDRKLVQALSTLPREARSALGNKDSVCIYLNPTPRNATRAALEQCLPVEDSQVVKNDYLAMPELQILKGFAKHFSLKCDFSRLSEVVEKAEFQAAMNTIKDLLVSLAQEDAPAPKSADPNPNRTRVPDNCLEQGNGIAKERGVAGGTAETVARQGSAEASGRRVNPGASPAQPISPAGRKADSQKPEQLVSRPRGTSPQKSSTPPPSGRDSFPSANSPFAALIIAAFVEGGRPAPNLRQVAAVQQAIPADSRECFAAELRRKMPRIEHPGVLSSVVEEFLIAWPAIQARKQAEQSHIESRARCACGGELIAEDKCAVCLVKTMEAEAMVS